MWSICRCTKAVLWKYEFMLPMTYQNISFCQCVQVSDPKMQSNKIRFNWDPSDVYLIILSHFYMTICGYSLQNVSFESFDHRRQWLSEVSDSARVHGVMFCICYRVGYFLPVNTSILPVFYHQPEGWIFFFVNYFGHVDSSAAWNHLPVHIIFTYPWHWM